MTYEIFLLQCVQFMVCSVHKEAEMADPTEPTIPEEDEAYLLDEFADYADFASSSSDEEMDQNVKCSKMQKPFK